MAEPPLLMPGATIPQPPIAMYGVAIAEPLATIHAGRVADSFVAVHGVAIAERLVLGHLGRVMCCVAFAAALGMWAEAGAGEVGAWFGLGCLVVGGGLGFVSILNADRPEASAGAAYFCCAAAFGGRWHGCGSAIY
jgi:hypothetical protein